MAHGVAIGGVIGAINGFYDITSRKQTEEALRQSLEDVMRMRQMSTRLLQGGDFLCCCTRSLMQPSISLVLR